MNEEEQKWRQYIKNVKPIHRGEKRQQVIDKITDNNDEQHYEIRKIKKSDEILLDDKKNKNKNISDIERSKLRKIGKNNQIIEKTIDLHGMNKEQAFAKLQNFLIQAVQQNCRYVKVITGKGEKKLSQPYFETEYKGVIRSAVIEWIKFGDLKKYVNAISKAHPQQGGDGAFYLQIVNRQKQN